MAPGQELSAPLPLGFSGSVSPPGHPGARRGRRPLGGWGHGPLRDWRLGVPPWWVPSFPVAWQPPQMIFFLAGCSLEVPVPSVGSVPGSQGGFSLRWSLAVPCGRPGRSGGSAGRGWVPGPCPRARGSWIEQVTGLVAAASPEGQRAAPASCRGKQRRGARELLHPPHPAWRWAPPEGKGEKNSRGVRKAALSPGSLGHEASLHHSPARRDPPGLRRLPLRAGTRLATRALRRGGGRGARAGGDTAPPGDGGQGALGAADQQRGLGAAGGRPWAQPHLVLHLLLRAPRLPALFVSCGDNAGGSAPLSPAPTPRATHPAIAQRPRGCRQKAALPAKRLLGSGSIRKSSMTSSGHRSQRKSPKPDSSQQNSEAWLYQRSPLLKTSPRSIENDRDPSPAPPRPAAGFGDTGTHRARCSDTGRACPGSAPACPSRPRPAP